MLEPHAAFVTNAYDRLGLESVVCASTVALLIYDYILTFSQELRFLALPRRGVVKVLFILNRYLPFVDAIIWSIYYWYPHIPAESCRTLHASGAWMIILGVGLTQVIIFMRTWAIWGCSKTMGRALVAVIIPAGVCVFVVQSMYVKSLTYTISNTTRVSGCLLSSASAIIIVLFIAGILLETVVVVLTVIKAVRQHRSGYQSPHFTGLISTICRDGIIFYFYLLSVSLVNLVATAIAPAEMAGVLVLLQRTLHSCLTTRALLNLQESRHPMTDSDGFPVSVVIIQV